jgi:hypothetical protein
MPSTTVYTAMMPALAKAKHQRLAMVQRLSPGLREADQGDAGGDADRRPAHAAGLGTSPITAAAAQGHQQAARSRA